jgi:hypothetical protein
MRAGVSSKSKVALIGGLALVAFAARALVPEGFMPAPARPLTLQICPEGFPAQLLHEGHAHHAGHSHREHCVFGSAGASGPLPQPPPLSCVWLPQPVPAARCIPAARVVELVHLPQPRGPPATV